MPIPGPPAKARGFDAGKTKPGSPSRLITSGATAFRWLRGIATLMRAILQLARMINDLLG
jgi:hypothetical protein